MQTLEERFVDRSDWPRGPWDAEPDKRQWRDPATGMPCLIVRNTTLGNLCGYVGVGRSHPAYGKDYDAVGVDVHGGLTYANKCAERICHMVEPGEDDEIWWLGFDMAHCDDTWPTDHVHFGTYKDTAYVTHECERLAKQLKALDSGGILDPAK